MASRQPLPVNKHETTNAPGRQDVLLTGLTPTQKGRHKLGKGRLGMQRSTLFRRLSYRRRDCVVVQLKWSLILNVISRGMMTKNPYGVMFCREFDRLLMCGATIVRERRNGGEISHFRRAETTSFHRPNRCASIFLQNHSTIKSAKST